MIDVDARLGELTDLLKHTAGHAESKDRAIQRLRAHDLGHAAAILEDLRNGPGVQLTVGENPVDAYSARKNAYDFIELPHATAEPGSIENLRFRYIVRLDAYDQHVQPLYGHIHYFSLDAIGKTLRDGGSLATTDAS